MYPDHAQLIREERIVRDPDHSPRRGAAEFRSGEVGAAPRRPAGEFERTLDINLSAAYRLAVAAAAAMTDGGSIINIASVLAYTTAGNPQAGYAASKAGLLGLTRDLAGQWTGRRGIRVNAIAPGFFATEMTEGHDARMEHIVEHRIPAGGLGRPEDQHTLRRPDRKGRER